MFLKKCTYSNDRTFLSIVESYRDDIGKPKQRTIKKMGYLNELVDQFDDPIDHFIKLAKSMISKVKTNSSTDLVIDLSFPIDSSYNLFNVGYVVLKAVYNELMLNEFFKNKQWKLNIDYSLNKNMELQVFSRILYPASKNLLMKIVKTFLNPLMRVSLRILLTAVLIIFININLIFKESSGKILETAMTVDALPDIMIVLIIILKLNIMTITLLMIVAK